MHDHSPLIVTLALDDASAAFFNALRKQYFPRALNYIAAHLTLFHHLPASEPSLFEDMEIWSKEQAPHLLQISEVKSIGNGVVYKVESPALTRLHKTMQAKWKAWLTPQDSQKLWPHITVQNKVSPEEAKTTLESLRAVFQPFTATGLGFDVWAYRGGPWKYLQRFPFPQG